MFENMQNQKKITMKQAGKSAKESDQKMKEEEILTLIKNYSK
jgi:hypothetical protein